MENSNTNNTNNVKKSRKPRAETPTSAKKKALVNGGIMISTVIKKEHGADLFLELADKQGSKEAAIRFLLDFYKTNQAQ